MPEISLRLPAFARRAAIALIAAAASLFALPAAASPASEAFVQTNVAKGLTILNNKSLSAEQKRSEFESFVLGLTNMRRIAMFTLGSYRRTSTPQEQDAFVSAFQAYAVAVYNHYFKDYSGQTLKVFGSQDKDANDSVVQTHLINPNDSSGKPPLEVDFRVVSDGSRMVVVDFGVNGIWVAIEEQAQFTSFLGNNGGSIAKLITDVNQKRLDVEAGDTPH